jgi:hypothetical protein
MQLASHRPSRHTVFAMWRFKVDIPASGDKCRCTTPAIIYVGGQTPAADPLGSMGIEVFDMRNVFENKTSPTDWGFGDVTALLQHNVMCADGSLHKGRHLKWLTKTQRHVYECVRTTFVLLSDPI